MLTDWRTNPAFRPLTYRLPGLVMTELQFQIPLDHDRPDEAQLKIFARAVAAPDKIQDELPWLVFFQGGPGFGAPRPDAPTGWLKRALKDYRILLVDGRGTGRSTPMTPDVDTVRHTTGAG